MPIRRAISAIVEAKEKKRAGFEVGGCSMNLADKRIGLHCGSFGGELKGMCR